MGYAQSPYAHAERRRHSQARSASAAVTARVLHKTSGKGQKGQKARPGHHGIPKPGFEGGQMPMPRRIPKRGFTNAPLRRTFPVNVGDARASASRPATVDHRRAQGQGPHPALGELVKILGDGELTKKLTSSRTTSRRLLKRSSRRPAVAARIIEQLASKEAAPAALSKESRWPQHRQYRQGSRAPQAHPVHAGAARGLSRRHLRHDSGRQPRRDEAGHACAPRARSSACSTCSPAARSSSCRSSPSASCRTSRRRSSCSCSPSSSRRSSGSTRKASRGRRRSTSTPATARSCCRWCSRASSRATSRASTAPTAQYGAVVAHPGLGFRLLTMLSLTTGTAFIMWLGEQITERGIGNGISLIIFAGIVAGFPDAVVRLVQKSTSTGDLNAFELFLILGSSSRVIAAISFFERGQRKIPVQYAKRVVGRKMYGGAVDAPAAQDQRRRRHPADLRVVDPDVPGADRELRQARVDAEGRRRAAAGRLALQRHVHRRSSSSSATSTRRSRSIRSTSPTT